MGLEKVQREANLKAPSPSPHPVPMVGVERIITERWNSFFGGDEGGGTGGGHIRDINISSEL